MGKGDRKTRRGKITIGSYGKLRPRRKKTGVLPSKAEEEKAAAAEKAEEEKAAAVEKAEEEKTEEN